MAAGTPGPLSSAEISRTPSRPRPGDLPGYVFAAPGNQHKGARTHWESYLYIGLVPLVLAIVALTCVRRREVLAWGVLGGLGLILALGQYSPINQDYALSGCSLRHPTSASAPSHTLVVAPESARWWRRFLQQCKATAPGLPGLQTLSASGPSLSDSRRLRRLLVGVLVRAGLPRGRRHRAARSPADLAVQRAGRDSGRVPVAAPRQLSADGGRRPQRPAVVDGSDQPARLRCAGRPRTHPGRPLALAATRPELQTWTGARLVMVSAGPELPLPTAWSSPGPSIRA